MTDGVTTPAGEDRLLDEVESAIRACQEEGRVTILGHDVVGPMREQFIANAPDWLARLCARVRHLEAELDETAKYATSRREEAETERARYAHYVLKAEATELASQRLTEALAKQCRAHAEVCPSHENCAVLQESRKLLAELGAGAPPEDAR